MMSLEEKYKAMLEGKVLIDDQGNRMWFDQAKGFRVSYRAGGSQEAVTSWVCNETPPWRVEDIVDTMKPCPFCGASGDKLNIDEHRLGGYMYVWCDCGARGPRANTKVRARDLWNIRQ